MIKKMKQPKVAIITATFNQEKMLGMMIRSVLSKTNYKNYKIFLVDDSGKGEIGERVKKKFKGIDVSINKKNLGFSKSNNIGIKKAIKSYNPDYFLLLNDDTEIIEKNWLKKMVEGGEKGREIGILGCKIIYPDGSLQNIGGYIRGWEIVKELNPEKKYAFEVGHIMGAFMFIKKEVIKKIGILDENYSPYLLEDTDYCIRAKKAGFKIESVPYVSIIHKKSKSITSKRDYERKFVRYKNDIYFSRKNLKGWDRFFRIFIYVPLVACFKKEKDEDPLDPIRLKVRLRKEFLHNLWILLYAFFYVKKKGLK